MDAQLEAKLRELIDRQEIWSLLLRYGRGIDRFDREMIRSCYWDDAIDDHHSFVGAPDDFIAWAMGFHGTYNTVHHHGVGNHYVEIDGDDAHGETYYTFIGAMAEPPHMLSIGRYIDHFQRRDSVWKIANRVCVIEKQFTLADGDDAGVAAAAQAYGPLRPAGRDRNDLSYQRPVVPRRPAAG